LNIIFPLAIEPRSSEEDARYFAGGTPTFQTKKTVKGEINDGWWEGKE